MRLILPCILCEDCGTVPGGGACPRCAPAPQAKAARVGKTLIDPGRGQ